MAKAKRNYKREYKMFQGRKSQIKYRAALNAEARKRKIYGKRGNMDLAHKKGGGYKLQKRSINRSFNGKGRRSRYSA